MTHVPRSLVSLLVLLASASLLVNLLFFVGESRAEENDLPTTTPDPNGKGPFDCWNIAMRAAKKMMKIFGNCTKEMKANTSSSKELSEKLGCVVKCTMQGIGFTNENNMVTVESMGEFVQQFLTNKYLINSFLEATEKSCFKGKPVILDPDEVKCESYGNLAMCLQTGLGDFVDNSPYCLPRKKRGSPAVPGG